MLVHRSPRPLKRLAAGLGAAFMVAAAAPSIASAGFETVPNPCKGDSVQGRGASFQNNAVTLANGFVAVFRSNDGCGTLANPVPQVFYDPAGSGAGRQALGVKNATTNPSQDRDPSVRFAASDEPPTPADRQQMQKGPIDANGADVTAADDGVLHVIPAAMGAVAVSVHLPANCDYSGATNKPLDHNRPAIDNDKLEKVFAGVITTWADAIPGVDATCGAKPITRVVRLDSSGTTFALKQFLGAINPTRGWASLDNTEWPSNATVVRGASNGNGPLADKLNLTDGGIGYGDLSGMRGKGFAWDNANDLSFWIPLQRRDSANYDDPQAAADGYKSSSAAKGANCNAVTPRNVPASSLGDWSAVDSTYSATGYGACTLTYDLAFDDNSTVYCNSAAEERKARTVKDYLTLGVTSVKGQANLQQNDYDALPGFDGTATPIPGSLYAISRAAVDSIGWKKNGGGRPCTAPPTNNNNNQNNNQNNNTTPPPTTISNAFTIASSRVSGTSIRLSLQLPGAGSVKVESSTKPKKGKTIKLSTKNLTVTKAGAQAISISLSSKAKSALKKDKKLKVTMKITYTPTGGTAKTTTKSITVKQAKKN